MKMNLYDKDRTPDGSQLNEVGKPLSKKTKSSSNWIVVALLVLSVFPLAAGAFRLTQLAGGAEITPANVRFFASPLPVVLHILSAFVYAFLGAIQFAPVSGSICLAGIGWPVGSWLYVDYWLGCLVSG